MATSSIIKDFLVKDQEAFEELQRDLDKQVPIQKTVTEPDCLKKSREKLASFVFYDEASKK